MGYISLLAYYRLNFLLSYVHKYPLSDVYKWYPFERDITVSMIDAHIQKSEQK